MILSHLRSNMGTWPKPRLKRLRKPEFRRLIIDQFDFDAVLAISCILAESFYFKDARKILWIAEEMALTIDEINGTSKSNKGHVMFGIRNYITKLHDDYELEKPLYPANSSFISEFLPGTKIHPRRKIDKFEADLLFEIDGRLCVGEVKPRAFIQKDVLQLQNYVDRYKASKSYAFALELRANLNTNMQYINVNGIKDRFYQKSIFE